MPNVLLILKVNPSLKCVMCLKQSRFLLPGAGAAASWRAEPPAAPTSEAVGASGWPGYSATVPAPGDERQHSSRKKCRL